MATTLKPKPKYQKPTCPRCGSKRVQTRKTDHKRWCRECLKEWDVQ